MKEKLCNDLYEKLNKENKEYKNKISLLSPKEIIKSAYPIAIKEELVDLFYGGSRFSIRILKALLEKDNTLEYLYDKWLNADGGIHEIIVDSIEDDLLELEEEYSDKLLNNLEQNKNFSLYSSLAEVCSNFDLYHLCEDLKDKFEVENLDIVDIDAIFNSKDGKKYMYNFLDGLKNNGKAKELSETNVKVYKQLEEVKNSLLPKLKELIRKDDKDISKKEHEER